MTPAHGKRTVRCRIYDVFLLALGLLTLILGLIPPRTTDVIIVGGAVIIAGLLEFALARGRTPYSYLHFPHLCQTVKSGYLCYV